MPEQVFWVLSETIGKLESSTLKEIKLTWMVNDELNVICQTVNAIYDVLLDEEHPWENIAFKKWLQDLKSIATDIGDEIDVILTQHALSLKVEKNGSTTCYQRFPGSRKARRLKQFCRRLEEINRNWQHITWKNKSLHKLT